MEGDIRNIRAAMLLACEVVDVRAREQGWAKATSAEYQAEISRTYDEFRRAHPFWVIFWVITGH